MSYKSKAQIQKMYDDINLKRDNVLPEDILEMLDEVKRLRLLMVAVWPYVHLTKGSTKAPRRYRDCVKSINKIVLDERDLVGDNE